MSRLRAGTKHAHQCIDLAPDAAGIKTVLQLRTKFATPQKSLSDPMKYVDLAYYNKAFGRQ